MQRWIGEYKSIGKRPLTEQEIQSLSRAIRKPRLLVIPTWFIGIVGIPVTAMSMMILEELHLALLGVFVAIVVMGSMISLPLLLRDARKQAKCAKNDLKEGVVETFEVPPTAMDDAGLELEDNEDDWDDDPDNFPEDSHPPIGSAIEVLKGSGTLISVNGKPSKNRPILIVSSVANPPHNPAPSAIPTRHTFNEQTGVAESERQLTSEEHKEINAFIAKSGKFPYFFAFLSLYTAGQLTASVLQGFSKAPVQIVCFGALGVFFVYIWFNFIKQMLRRRAIKKDLKRGFVTSHDTSLGRSTRGKATIIEFLPLSDVVWTVDGKPADWRKTV